MKQGVKFFLIGVVPGLILFGGIVFWWGAGSPHSSMNLEAYPQQASHALPPTGEAARERMIDSPDTGSATAGASLRQQESPRSLENMLSEALKDYHSRENEVADRQALHQIVRTLSQSADGRRWIVTHFFQAPDSLQSVTLYDVLLDADVKDPALVVALIHRDQSETATEYTRRILDLIADMGTSENAPFRPEVDAYLAQVSRHSDAALRDQAVSRRIWYLTQHGNVTAAQFDELILNPSAAVREELYQWVELTGFSQQESTRSALAQSLKSLLYADYLGLATPEKQRVERVIEQLSEAPVGNGDYD